MSSRAMILAAVRGNAPAAAALPEVPLFDQGVPSLLGAFREAFELLGGTFAELAAGEMVEAAVARLFPSARVVCSVVPELTGTKRLADVASPAELEDVDVGVVRPVFGVAETGSLFLSEAELGVNALGYLAQHLVALLDPADIVPNLHHAYRRPEFRTARYAVLMTGPSATADIEGVLIRGAQGVRSLTVLPVARAG